MELEEFKSEKMKRHQSHKFKVTGSFGVYDAFKHIRKNHWYDIGRPLKEKEFYGIVRGINNLLAENIANGITVKFPQQMGVLELRKWERGASIIGDRLKVTYPVNWYETWKLWYKDPDAYRSRVLLRDEQKEGFSVRYLKREAAFENKIFYQFTLNRFIRQALKENIKKGKVDTLW